MVLKPCAARTAAALLSAAAAAFGAPACAANPAEDGRGAVAFVAGIYHRYSARVSRAVDYDGAEASQVFTPEMAALMRRSHAAHADEELDWLSDHDLLCLCQDFADIHAKVRLERLDNGRAWVAATIVDPPTHDPPQTLRFELVRQGSVWRIADLVDPRSGSLRRALDEDARKFPVRPRKRPQERPAIEPKAGPPRPKTGGG